MSTSTWSRALDRVNPIVVKEIRQGLRTRSFWVFFALQLLSCLVIALVAFAISAQEASADPGGPYYFFAFFFALAVVSFFLVPYGAFRSLAREREDETWVLLTLTGLGPRRILFGKLSSALLQASLYGSAAAPFVLFSYYLNGVDLPTILLMLGLAFVYMLFLTSVCVSAATLGETRMLRTILHLGVLVLLLGMTGWGIGMAGGLSFEGRRIVSDPDFYTVIGFVLWSMASYGVLLFEAAAARLSLPTEDYAKGPRLAALVQWLVTTAIVVALWWHDGMREGGAVAYAVGMSVHLGLVGMFLSSERDGQAKLHRTRTKWFSLLRPGALRGYRFTVGLLLGATATAATMAVGIHVTGPERIAIIIAPAYALLYLSAPLVVARGIGWFGRSPAAARITTVVVLFLGCGLPPLIALLVGKEPDDTLINLFNPLIGLVRVRDLASPFKTEWGPIFLWLVALFSGLAADRVLAWRDKARA